LQIKGPDKEQAERFRQLNKKKEEKERIVDEKDHAVQK
jgi:hypothetical protein